LENVLFARTFLQKIYNANKLTKNVPTPHQIPLRKIPTSNAKEIEIMKPTDPRIKPTVGSGGGLHFFASGV
jgi:hypothetical protein